MEGPHHPVALPIRNIAHLLAPPPPDRPCFSTSPNSPKASQISFNSASFYGSSVSGSSCNAPLPHSNEHVAVPGTATSFITIFGSSNSSRWRHQCRRPALLCCPFQKAEDSMGSQVAALEDATNAI